jgi:hypothetical protein
MADTANVSVRFSTQDSELVRRALQQLGEDGQRTLEKLERASNGPSQGLRVLNEATNQARSGLEGLATRLGPAGAMLSAMGPAGTIAAVALATFSAGLAKATAEAAQAELEMARVSAVLNATGHASGRTAEQVETLAESISRSTLATEAEAKAASTALLTLGSVAGDQFDRTLTLAQDLAAAGFGSMSSAATALGKALADPAANLDALRRAGVALTAQEREHIGVLAEQGRAYEAKAALLDAVQQRVGGAGRAEGDTLTGAMHALNEVTGEYFEMLGQKAGSVDLLKAAIRGLQSAVVDATLAMTAAGELAALENAAASNPSYMTVDRKRRADELRAILEAERQVTEEARRYAEARQRANDLDTAQANIAADTTRALQVEMETQSRHVSEHLAEGIENTKRAAAARLKEEQDAARRAADYEAEVFRRRVSNFAKLQDEMVRMIERRDDADLRAAEKSRDEALRLQSEANREFEGYYRQSAQAFQDTVLGAMDEGWGRTLDRMGARFVRFLVAQAAEAAARPILVSIAATTFGAGVSGTAAAAASGAAGGASTSLLAGAAGGGLAGWTSGALTSLNLWGASNLGLSSGVTFVPAQFGAEGLSITGGGFAPSGGATLTGTLGAIGLGALGAGVLASLTGMRNPTAASIGGGIGGGAGYLLGSATPLGPIGGAIVGALLGSLAGLFGAKPSDKTEATRLFWDQGGRREETDLGPKKDSPENRSAVNQLVDAADQFRNMLKVAGLNVTASQLGVQVGNRGNPFRVELDGKTGEFGDGRAAFDWVAKQLVASLKDVPAQLQQAIDRIDWSNLEKAGADLEFALNFDAIVKALKDGTTNLQESARIAASQEIQAAVKWIRDFKESTTRLGLSTEEANAATKAYVNELVGMTTGKAPLTGVEQALERLRGVCETLTPLLQEVGETGYTAADVLSRGIGALTAATMGDINSRLNDALGRGYLNTISGAITSFRTDVTNLTALGADTGPALTLFRTVVGNIISSTVTGGGTVPKATEALNLIKTTFANFPEVIALVDTAMGNLNETLGISAQQADEARRAAEAASARVQSMIQEAANAQRAALSSLAGRSSRIAESASAALLSLDTDASLSGMGPEATRNALYSALTSAFADSQKGGELGIAGGERVLELWRPFLESSKAFHRSTAGFYKDQELVKGILGQTKSIQQTQVDLLSAQVQRLDTLISLSGGRSNVAPIGPTTANDLRAAEGEWNRALQNWIAGGGTEASFYNSDVVKTVFVPLRDRLIGGLTDTSALFKTITDAQGSASPLAAGQEAAARARLAQLGIPVPFANGGVVDGPTFAVLGEGRYRREAAVPLPDGRAIHAVVHDTSPDRICAVLDRIERVLERLAESHDQAAHNALAELRGIKTNTGTAMVWRRVAAAR